MVNRHLTKKVFHVRINPEREVEEDAAKVHGMTWAQLQKEPLFEEVVDDFLMFIKDSELIIHNAAFDVAYLNMEL
jgi:DNA polymerase-3 subunit epsilon